MNRNKVLGLLGLAEKAGKVRSDRIGRIFGQHKENVPEHVYLL